MHHPMYNYIQWSLWVQLYRLQTYAAITIIDAERPAMLRKQKKNPVTQVSKDGDLTRCRVTSNCCP